MSPSESDYTMLSNNIAVHGSRVVLAPNSAILTAVLHNLQTLYALELQRNREILAINQRIDRIESALRKAGIISDDGEDDQEDFY